MAYSKPAFPPRAVNKAKLKKQKRQTTNMFKSHERAAKATRKRNMKKEKKNSRS